MITRRNLVGLAAAVPALPVLLTATSARAAEPRIFQQGGLALGGTDPVAYFEGNGPVRGDGAHALDWMDARWTFASATNRDAFAADPERFAPAFGGYCAFAASRGYLAPTIPEAWSLHEGRLFLNASLRARELWLAELPGVIAAGEANWPAILG
ncbi:YHS domain protein [Roseibacterium sp. SDUM158016]|uniref:YHS domain-containing (seleno)protein n=1 Tax=Roseicyclus sediminis TaxID=2980997 RepID=UPI0021D0B9F6|nr:YHS domain-containing (seleno)protein [Roseibacterium sp. SDUM158016]MCU4652845.1 YHS domain protein [Roseibacterium sp. SDUM158016]